VNINVVIFLNVSIIIVLLFIGNNINDVSGRRDTSPVQCGHDVRGIDARGVMLINFCTIPSTVAVGDNFTLNATVLNYSPNSIEIAPTGPFCDNPLTVSFDKNVKINLGAAMPACMPRGPALLIPAGQYTPLSVLPERGIASFSATSTGETTAVLKLNYSQLHQNKQVCGAFTFKIMPSFSDSIKGNNNNNATKARTLEGLAPGCSLSNPNNGNKPPCRPPFIPDPDDPRRCAKLQDKGI
jgi:hypothetical protein